MIDNITEKIQETTTNLIAPGTLLEGKIVFENTTRIHGTLKGEVLSKPESTLILCESGRVEGNIQADTLIVGGYVKGDITATTKVTLTKTGRVIGNIKSPCLAIEFGAYFEGNSTQG